MKEKYENPTLELIELDAGEDIITQSGLTGQNQIGGEDPFLLP